MPTTSTKPTIRPPHSSAFLGAVMLGIQLVFLISFAVLLIRARMHAGEWPHPRSGNPFDGSYRAATMDPNALGAHCMLVWAALTAVLYTGPIAAFALVALLVPWARRRAGIALCLAATSGICALVLLADPFGFVLWLAD